MDLQLQNRRVLVTAGAAGIGLHIAQAFLDEGARVHVLDIDADALSALAVRHPGIAQAACDLSSRAQIAREVPAAIDRLGGLDVLVNNAGIPGPTARVEDVAPADWDRALAVNLSALFDVTRLCVPALRRRPGGAILNIASLAGRVGFPLRSAYAASKWGVVGFTRTLSMELGADGIRVNALLPGAVDGPRVRQVLAAKAAQRGVPVGEIEREALRAMSIRHWVDPGEVARLAVFAASPRMASLSGQALSIDGDAQSMA